MSVKHASPGPRVSFAGELGGGGDWGGVLEAAGEMIGALPTPPRLLHTNPPHPQPPCGLLGNALLVALSTPSWTVGGTRLREPPEASLGSGQPQALKSALQSPRGTGETGEEGLRLGEGSQAPPPPSSAGGDLCPATAIVECVRDISVPTTRLSISSWEQKLPG